MQYDSVSTWKMFHLVEKQIHPQTFVQKRNVQLYILTSWATYQASTFQTNTLTAKKKNLFILKLIPL